jgi:hypothetical protein
VSAVEFHHRKPHSDKPRLEVRANRPVLLIAVDADGKVVVHVAADTWAQAGELLDELQAHAEIGEAVRLLVERGTEEGEAE